ncbi:hypothetical protein CC80DRAFT_47800 [Byssothecium circinans]|uniref:Uncharacterized protein n=1 Tax=Byssothecium circinans TaxID=147558 RepID=A0A6A5U3N5_9PLEO|nr:hypothetical protein CC80DRAFT_47800 [Byssothecium circinans]
MWHGHGHGHVHNIILYILIVTPYMVHRPAYIRDTTCLALRMRTCMCTSLPLPPILLLLVVRWWLEGFWIWDCEIRVPVDRAARVLALTGQPGPRGSATYAAGVLACFNRYWIGGEIRIGKGMGIDYAARERAARRWTGRAGQDRTGCMQSGMGMGTDGWVWMELQACG